MHRLVVLASGAGTTLQAIMEACPDPLGAEVVAVGTDRQGTEAERRARSRGIPVFTISLESSADREDFSTRTAEAIAKFEPHLLVLAGYMKILGPAVIERFPTVNTHPALSPAFPGAHAVEDALAHGVKVTGVTIHWVDRGVDTGKIISQCAVEVNADDTSDSLRARIQSVERQLYVETIQAILEGS